MPALVCILFYYTTKIHSALKPSPQKKGFPASDLILFSSMYWWITKFSQYYWNQFSVVGVHVLTKRMVRFHEGTSYQIHSEGKVNSSGPSTITSFSFPSAGYSEREGLNYWSEQVHSCTIQSRELLFKFIEKIKKMGKLLVYKRVKIKK